MRKIGKKKNKNEVWETTKKALGIVLIAIGILGLFLPILQGILFIVIGLALYHNQSIKKTFLNLTKKIKSKLKK